jgi:hypothetical protein
MSIVYMVLLGKLLATETSCILFKMPPPSQDTMNVFMACPLHVLKPNDFKVKIQVIGNNTTRVSFPTFITAVLFPVQHPFLDLALGVIQDPEAINNTPELKAISYLSVDDSNANIENSEVDVLYANKLGGVNRLPSRILSMNYELGSQEQQQITHALPAPGGFIEVELDAKSGLSGGLLVNRNGGDNPSILGMIIVSSSTSSNEKGGDCNLQTSKNLASKMFYIAPHISQCTSSFYRLTLNDPVKLAGLCDYINMQTFKDDALPIVNHLGGDYINNAEINRMNPFRHLTLLNVHNFLSVSPLALNQENTTNSIRIITALNSNPDFLNFFFSKQANSVVFIRSATYVDKIKGMEITLNFEDDMTNILDWCYRGDPFANLQLVCQLRTMNNNGEITLSDRLPFTFYSSETVDRVHDRNYPRRNMQIPRAFFNKLNSFQVLQNFGTDLPRVMHLFGIFGPSCRIRFFDQTTEVWSDVQNFPSCSHPQLSARLDVGDLACRRSDLGNGNERWIPLTNSRDRLKELGRIQGEGASAECIFNS